MAFTGGSTTGVRLLVRVAAAAALGLGASLLTATATSAHHRPDHIEGPTPSSTLPPPTVPPPTTAPPPPTTVAPPIPTTPPPTPIPPTVEPDAQAPPAPPEAATNTAPPSTAESTTAPSAGSTPSTPAATQTRSTATTVRLVPLSSSPQGAAADVAPASGSGSAEAAPPPATAAPPPAAAAPSPSEGAGSTGAAVAIGARDPRLDRVLADSQTGDSPLVELMLAGLLAVLAACVLFYRDRWPMRAGAAAPAAARVAQLSGRTGRVTSRGVPAIGPSPDRIGSRLVALVAVAERASLEYRNARAREERDRVLTWVDGAGAGDELENGEQAILRWPPGTLDASTAAEASWQIEGAAVMAWALGLLDDLPWYDRAMDPAVLSAILGFPDAERTRSVLRSVAARRPTAIDAEAARYQGTYWQLREIATALQTRALEPWSPPVLSRPGNSPTGPSTGRDLVVAGTPAVDADPEAVDLALGITGERLRALNWLASGGRYSEVRVGGRIG